MQGPLNDFVRQNSVIYAIDLLNEPNPCALDQVTHQAIKGPKTVSHSGFQGDRRDRSGQVVIEKVQPITADGLELPEWHFRDRPLDLVDQRLPEVWSGLSQPKKRAVLTLSVDDLSNDRCLAALVLQKRESCFLTTKLKWSALLPV